MTYGYAHAEDGRVIEVNNAEDWGWLEAAQRNGDAYVLSCSDRFPHPPEYYAVFVGPGQSLEAAKHNVVSRGMQDVLCVYRLGPEYPLVPGEQQPGAELR